MAKLISGNIITWCYCYPKKCCDHALIKKNKKNHSDNDDDDDVDDDQGAYILEIRDLDSSEIM